MTPPERQVAMGDRLLEALDLATSDDPNAEHKTEAILAELASVADGELDINSEG